jgi:hypothetical protein
VPRLGQSQKTLVATCRVVHAAHVPMMPTTGGRG